ncbi:polymer-forming cytoskeletal protein [bacterium]|nr:polymer-forming cytoskeletal protein [bacterium]
MIGKDIKIKGEIKAEEDIVIEGHVEGNVTSTKEIVVGEHGRVQAAIEADSVIIKGQLTGNVKARTVFQLVATGKMNGDITSPKVNIAEGARFQGKIDMISPT